jgi:hypothetical protein
MKPHSMKEIKISDKLALAKMYAVIFTIIKKCA